MAKPNEIEIEILEDGEVRMVTGKIAMPIHSKTDEALKKVQSALGGAVKIEQMPHSHADTGRHIHGSEGIQH
jgi:hypothetical protein